MGLPKVTINDFIERSNNLHSNKYDYSKVEWVNTKVNINIVCPIHGIFSQKPYKHLQGQGCPKCSGRDKLTQVEFIERAKKNTRGKHL